MPRINLLPWREQQRAERKKAFGVGMFGAFIGAFVVAVAAWLLVNQMMDAQRNRNQRLRAEITQLDKQIEEINSLETQKQQFIARMQIIETLQRSRPEIVHVFDTVPRVIPDGVYLTSMQQTGNAFKLQGITQSPARVATFMRAVTSSEWLTEPDVEIVQGTTGNSSFTLNARQVTAPPAAQ